MFEDAKRNEGESTRGHGERRLYSHFRTFEGAFEVDSKPDRGCSREEGKKGARRIRAKGALRRRMISKSQMKLSVSRSGVGG